MGGGGPTGAGSSDIVCHMESGDGEGVQSGGERPYYPGSRHYHRPGKMSGTICKHLLFFSWIFSALSPHYITLILHTSL